MMKWTGAAGLCRDGEGRLLMILQGAPEDDDKKWSIPTAMIEEGGSLEQVVEQEIREVTGCEARAVRQVETEAFAYPQVGIEVEMHYFETEITDGTPNVPEEDELITDVGWKTAEEIESLELMYPEERDVLVRYAGKVH